MATPFTKEQIAWLNHAMVIERTTIEEESSSHPPSGPPLGSTAMAISLACGSTVTTSDTGMQHVLEIICTMY